MGCYRLSAHTCARIPKTSCFISTSSKCKNENSIPKNTPAGKSPAGVPHRQKGLAEFAPADAKKVQSFSPAACTAEKIPLGSQTCALCACGVQCVRCSELQSLPTRTQRSGPRWGALTRCCPGTCPQRAARAAPRPRPAGRRDTSRRARRRPCAAWSRPPCRRAAARPRPTAQSTRT